MTRDEIAAWLSAMRGKSCIKALCGIRGVGKSHALAAWRDAQVAAGYPEERVVCIDMEDPVLRRLITADDALRYLSTQLPPSGPVMLLLEEPTSFHDYERLLEQLLGLRRIDIYLTLSSRRLVSSGLSDFLRGALAVCELLPPTEGLPQSTEAMRARWCEILLRDVLPAPGVANGNIAERLAAFLADSVGDPISLRSAAAAISPHGKVFSPNTVEAYLSALEDAHVVERCYQWDGDFGEPIKRDYRVFFTDPALSRECFGMVPDFERRRELNARWLALRNGHARVYLARVESPDSPLTFVTDPTRD